MKTTTVAGFLVAIAALGSQVVACNSASTSAATPAKGESAPQGTAVATARAREEGMGLKPITSATSTGRLETRSYSGEVRAKTQVTIAAKMMGRIEQMHVDVGSEVKTGNPIATLERSALDAQLRQAEAALTLAQARLAQMEAGGRPEAVAQAEANLDSAREKLAAMGEGGRSETVAQAEAALHAAEAKLAQLKAGATPQQIEQAEAAVRAARNQLYATQAQADAQMGSGRAIFTKEMKEAQSGAAYEQVKAAEARLAELKAGATKEQLDQAQAAVNQARAALEVAQQPFTAHDLKQAANAVIAAEQQSKLAQNPFTGKDLEVARAQVTQAQAALDAVKAQMADTIVVSPIDGVVSERFLSLGALAMPGAPIAVVVSHDLEVVLALEETQTGKIGVGQPVTVTIGAYPDKEFVGSIASMAPTVDPKTRMVAARISVSDPERRLRAGMFARVVIAAGEPRSGLFVPSHAIGRREEKSYVAI